MKHTGEKSYKCNKCDYSTQRRNDLRLHMMKHTGENPYKCNKCDYSTQRHNDLRLHMMKHTGEKSYKCNKCDYSTKARCTRYDLSYMILSYMTSRTVYTGVFRVACDIFQVACDFFEIEHCSNSKKSHMILVYLNSKKVSII